ncbi:distal tail protein Dit [Lactococcus lactis]|uniref:distal tail protein Dit n=1 Tax=Lactococcus lactis TaxID=1358 RepID=UPI0021A4D93A|nr:distal tail protein Dit [Lactococcus lactis]MCT3132583.1 phage tail protein [Lactococcus lactis]
MAFTVKYDGNFLTDHMRIIDVHRNLGAGITSTTEENVFSGADFVRSRRDKSTIEVEFRTFDNITTARRQLAKLTSSSIPAELIFSDEPNLYYQAIRQGEITLTESKSKLFATGTIIFLIPAGEAESVDTKVLNEDNSGGELGTITHNADGSTKVQINNQGTLETFPQIKITNVDENGYLGLVNPNGILELGKRDEADGETVPESEVLYTTDSDLQFSDFVDVSGKVNPQIASVGGTCDTTGKIGYLKDGLRLITPSTATGSTHRGGMLSLDIPPDSNGEKGSVNFYAWFNIFVHALQNGQTGLLQIMFTDSNDKFVAGYGIVKSDKTGNTGAAKFWVGGDHPKEYKSITFTTNDGEQTKDPNNNTMFNSKKGSADFVKQGASLGFYWKGSRQTINVPELENVPIERVYIFIGNFTNSNKFLGELSLRRFWCRKDKVDVWHDLPNRYQAGSVMELDMENGKITKDGISSNNELVTGSEFISLPSGETELDIYQSSWNTTPPQIEIQWKERYL